MAVNQALAEATPATIVDGFSSKEWDQETDDMIDVEDLARMAEGEPDGEQNDEEAPAEDSTEATETAEAAPSLIKVGEKEYDPTELAELVSKGEGFTQKTQTLAEERREFESAVVFANDIATAFDTPDGARALIERMMKTAMEKHGSSFTGVAPVGGIQLDEYADDDVKQVAQVALATHAENAQLKAIVDAQGKQIAEFGKFLEQHGGVIAETSLRASAPPIVAELERLYKVKVTADDIADAVRTTGEKDPIKAFKLANFDKLATGALKPAIQAAQPRNTPAPSSSEVFDFSNMGFAEVQANLNAGKVPKGFKPTKPRF